MVGLKQGQQTRAVHRRVKLPASCVAAVLIVVALGGCLPKFELPPTGPAGAQVGGKVTFGLSSMPSSLNPAFAQWDVDGLELAKSVFDTLTVLDAGGNPQPSVAQRLDHNAGYTQWTLTIRDGVYLSNGVKVTAETVRRNQQHLKDTVTTKQPYDPIVAFTVVSEMVLQVDMKEPHPGYPNALATQLGIVADPDWLDTANGDSPVGSGPFKLAAPYVAGQPTRLVKNPSYWRTDEHGTRLPYLNEADFVVVTDNAARVAGLQDGTLDLAHTTDPPAIAANASLRPGLQVYTTSGDLNSETPEVFVQTNGMDPLFSDREARQALAYATDKNAIASGIGAGVVEPANGPYAPGSKWYAPDVASHYPQFDQAKARQAVANVKARHGGQFSFSVEYLTGPVPPELTVLQAQWASVGVTASLVPVDSLTRMIHAFLGQYSASFWRAFDAPNPLIESPSWHPRAVHPVGEWSMAFARNTDDQIGVLLDDARHTTDHNAQLADYQGVQRLLGDDVPYIWLYHGDLQVLASAKLANVVASTLPPDGQGRRSAGLPIQQGFHSLAEVWVRS